MTPVFALLGRPNVGKSSLFNRLTKSRDALVADMPGLTRDRQFGQGIHNDQPFIAVDTGGLGEVQGDLEEQITEQAVLAARQADAVLFLVDTREGLQVGDTEIAQKLRALDKPIQVAVNKAEGILPETAASDFHALGLGQPLAISAAHGLGVSDLLDNLFRAIGLADDPSLADEPTGIKITVIGRPNVGKSTLINALLGEERLLTLDQPGTTRDSIYVPFQYQGDDLVLIDTAGLRRRGRINEVVEKFSVIKTLRAIEDADVAIAVVDAEEIIADQDLHLIAHAVDQGCALVVAINKWDATDPEQRERVKSELDRRLGFIDYAPRHTVSALRGNGLEPLLKSAVSVYRQGSREFSTNELTRLAVQFQQRNPPPMIRGRRIKLRYVHQGGRNPPTFVIHGNQTRSMSAQYQRYLSNAYRKALRISGTPIRLLLREGENPYKGRRNELTGRQQKKRERQKRFYRKRR